jgi:hypothetical protein
MNRPLVINIPTRGRVGNIKTLQWLPALLKEFIHFWCPAEEIEQHQQKWYAPRVGEWHAAPVGIAASRQAQAEWALANGVQWLWMMDDDITRFDRRASADSAKLTLCEEDDIYSMMHRLLDLTTTQYNGHSVAVVGIANRGGNNNSFPKTEEFCTKIYGCWAYHVPTLFNEGIRFDFAGPRFFMEDHHVQLSFLERGYATVRIEDYTWDQSKSNASGGCSLDRTPETMADAAMTLHRCHPSSVKVVTKEANWAGMQTRTDVTVQWKKTLSKDKPTLA